MNQALLDRIGRLAPAHKQDVFNVVAGVPELKIKFETGSYATTGANERTTYLDLFEKYAGWTIPALFPQEYAFADEVQSDYQSFGAQAVNNLANKIVTTLFHPVRPFFRAKVPEKYIRSGEINPDDMESELTALEKKCMERFAEKDGRTAMTNLILQLIVTGNGLLHELPNEKYRVFSYRDYDATFDTWGNMAHCIVREWTNVNMLSAEHAKICIKEGKDPNDMVQVFTGIRRIAMGYYLVWQEIEDYAILSDGYGVYSEETVPWKPQRLMSMANRHAGIGLVEQFAGDFHKLSKLALADLDILAIITDVKTLVKPGGKTKVADLNSSLPGAYLPGQPEDLHSHMHDMRNQGDFVDKKTQEVIRRLSQVFLLNSNVIRDAERVTAEEVRYIANELDQVHGGMYSMLARSLQRPIALGLMRDVNVAFKDFKPLIITGLESLSRMSELDSYRGLIGDLSLIGQSLQGPHAAWINLEKLTTKFASGWGIDVNDVMYTPQEKAAEDERKLRLQAQISAAEGIGQKITQ